MCTLSNINILYAVCAVMLLFLVLVGNSAWFRILRGYTLLLKSPVLMGSCPHRWYLNHMPHIVLLAFIHLVTNISALTAPSSAVGHKNTYLPFSALHVRWKYIMWWYYTSVASCMLSNTNHFIDASKYIFWYIYIVSSLPSNREFNDKPEGSKYIHDIQIVSSALWATKICP